MVTIYGIKNCDKCRKAVRWFEATGTAFRFHDLREDGLNTRLLSRWQKSLPDGDLLNRRSQTWRQIPAAERENLHAAGERRLAATYPTVIQRPVVEAGNTVTIGYDETAWKALI